MKKIIAAMMALVMVLSLAACGGKETDKVSGDSGKDSSREEAETIVLGKYTAEFKGYTLTKDEDGNDALVLTYDYTNGSKDAQSFAWAFLFEATQAGEDLGSPMFDENGDQITINYEEEIERGETLEVTFALTLVNTTDDVTIHFFDFDDHEYTQTVELPGTGSSASSGGLKPLEGGNDKTDKPEEPQEPQEPEAPGLTPYQEFWAGDWYGWWLVTNATGDFEGWDDGTYWWDCCAEIEIDENGDGRLILWDEFSAYDNPLAELDVCITDGGYTEGRMKSVSGWFWDGEIGNADWLVDPDSTYYEHLICIEGSYTDPGDFFSGIEYEIYLRPWGMDWEDVAEEAPEALPGYYYNWYLPAIESGAAMPDVIGGDYEGQAPGEVPDEQTEPQGGGSVEEIPDSGTLGEYGFSVADATGVVPLETLKAAYRYIKEHTSDLTYGAVYAQMGGVHGVAQTSGSAWQSGNYEYKWSAESGEYLYVTFSVDADGNERMKGMSSSLGLGD